MLDKKIIWNKLTEGKSIELVGNEDSLESFDFPFKVKFENTISGPTKFTYEEDGKEISFIPYGIKIGNTFIEAVKNPNKQ